MDNTELERNSILAYVKPWYIGFVKIESIIKDSTTTSDKQKITFCLLTSLTKLKIIILKII